MKRARTSFRCRRGVLSVVLGTPSSWYELEVGCPLEKELLVASEEASFRLS